MATLEDKILGEKLHYYCSSSEDEEESDNCSDKTPIASATSADTWNGTSSNTGPKGVIKDWQRFKQLDAERRKEQEKEKLLLAKKLALNCRSHLDDEKAKEAEKEDNVDDLIDDEILQQYILQRMKEMMKVTSECKRFGELLAIHSGEEFLEVVDQEDEGVTVIVHLFELSAPGCERMNRCLINLASEYPQIKFCCLQASDAGLSRRFQGTGVPALLVYKAGEMVGNFVRLLDEFDEDFVADDVASFLVENGVFPDKSLESANNGNIRNSSICLVNDSDSD